MLMKFDNGGVSLTLINIFFFSLNSGNLHIELHMSVCTFYASNVFLTNNSDRKKYTFYKPLQFFVRYQVSQIF